MKTLLAALAAALLLATTVLAGADDDGLFARQLWTALARARLVGDGAIAAVPYAAAGDAHGAQLVTLERFITVNARDGFTIVKRTYGGEGANRQTILADPASALTAVSVMHKRDSGYDRGHENWFWAMYAPDGTVATRDGAEMAGRVPMCIECHEDAPGGDMVFLHGLEYLKEILGLEDAM